MPTTSGAQAHRPDGFEAEWARARDLIEKQDERIHETRKLVFGLFPALLTAGTILGAKVEGHGPAGLGLHLTLLGLLLTGRFIEQQSYLLQVAAVSRAWALELLAPNELTGVIADRFASGWPRRTTYIYVALGVVSLIVTGLAGRRPEAGALALNAAATILYVAYVAIIGRREITYAREGQDWSFSTLSCAPGEPVSILLVNQGDAPLQLPLPAAELWQVFDEKGAPGSSGPVPLQLPPAILDEGQRLPPRMACRWVWVARPGVWALKVSGGQRAFARRFIHVQATPPTPVAGALAPGSGA